MRNRLYSVLGIALFLGVLLGIFFISFRRMASNNHPSVNCAVTQISDENLFNSLIRYERWINQYKDTQQVYKRQQGYPMYLYSFGIMYARLYELSCESRFLQEFVRIVDGIGRIRNDDWTWSFYDGTEFSTHKDAKSSLYNAMFAELFIEAWLLTGNPKDKTWASAAIEKIEDTLPSHQTYNYYFFLTIHCSSVLLL